jgi:glycerol transport system ATP-binding protein
VGTPEVLFERPEHTFVGYFIGSPGMNVLECDLQGDKALIHGHTVQLDQIYDTPTSKNVKLGVRPEHLTLTAPGGDGLQVKILRVDDIGRHKVVRVALNGNELNVIMPEMQGMTADQATLVVAPEHTNIYVDEQRVTGGAR